MFVSHLTEAYDISLQINIETFQLCGNVHSKQYFNKLRLDIFFSFVFDLFYLFFLWMKENVVPGESMK